MNGLRQFLLPPTSGFTNRTLHIRSRDAGTAFILERNEKQYLVTAAHLLNLGEPENLKVSAEGDWIDCPCTLLGFDEKLDIAVLRLPELFGCYKSPIGFGGGTVLWGQPVWFLGFPYGLGDLNEIHAEGKLPMPYVKWGSVSSLNYGQETNAMCLDAINNPGFSGGPVGYSGMSEKQTILGIVTGYREEIKFVEGYSGNKLEGAPTYQTNTGLVRMAKAEAVLELVDQKPDGMPF